MKLNAFYELYNSEMNKYKGTDIHIQYRVPKISYMRGKDNFVIRFSRDDRIQYFMNRQEVAKEDVPSYAKDIVNKIEKMMKGNDYER